jgi:hypothetical protein
METDLEWREYYLKEAASALKEGLPITARQCLKNAELFKILGDNTPITNKPMGE